MRVLNSEGKDILQADKKIRGWEEPTIRFRVRGGPRMHGTVWYQQGM